MYSTFVLCHHRARLHAWFMYFDIQLFTNLIAPRNTFQHLPRVSLNFNCLIRDYRPDIFIFWVVLFHDMKNPCKILCLFVYLFLAFPFLLDIPLKKQVVWFITFWGYQRHARTYTGLLSRFLLGLIVSTALQYWCKPHDMHKFHHSTAL